jgi:large subunit ribosomal protein L15
MSLSLSNLKPSRGSVKKRKRIGRGNASGTGTYSGKGLKGQKSRSGVSNLKRLGMKSVRQQTPKLRGFKSLKPNNQPINIVLINNNFKEGELVNSETLFKKGLIDNLKKPVKILGKGELKVKNLTVEQIKISESAKQQLLKLGGKIK